MSDEVKERRCKFCGKLLIDEKLSVCRRCGLEKRNEVGKVGIISGVVIAADTVRRVVALINNKSDDSNDTMV